MALEAESQGLVDKLGYDVLYCGVGKVNATYHLTKHLGWNKNRTYTAVLNMGSAGSNAFKQGSLVAANSFVQYDMNVVPLGFPIGTTPFESAPSIFTFPKHFEHLPHGTCGTADTFLTKPPPIKCEMFDMEAYALAKVCFKEEISFASVKYITDGADGAAANDWQTNLHKAAESFFKLLLNHQ